MSRRGTRLRGPRTATPVADRAAAGVAVLAAVLAGCSVTPRYEVPSTPLSASFKEDPGWVRAAPADALERGAWWELFGDPILNALEQRVAVSNQNVAAAAAAYEQAHALLRAERATLWPTLTLDGSAQRSGGRGGERAGGAATRLQLGLGAGWEPDVWGRLRAGIGAAGARAQASAADLAAATLSAQADLAVAYFGVRLAEAQMALLDETIAGYERALQINRNRYEAGVVARTDVLQAQTQLANAQADRVSLAGQRARFEHAVAVLVGDAPANVALAPAASSAPGSLAPAVPIGVPSTLLERRPDIAAAERRVAAANEDIGVARGAYFPLLNLSASYGLGASRVGDLFSASAAAWSFGASLAQTLFDAGARGERVEGSRAAHAQAVARYRQTVLAAFQEVEDQLAATRTLEQQFALRDEAARAAADVERQIGNRYRAGQVGYTEVVTAQVTALNARRALAQIASDRQTTAVALIRSLGGGWRDERVAPSAAAAPPGGR